jgi:hypothetical protein
VLFVCDNVLYHTPDDRAGTSKKVADIPHDHRDHPRALAESLAGERHRMKVSLSHSTKDKQFVQALAAELEAENIQSWIWDVDVEFGGNLGLR